MSDNGRHFGDSGHKQDERTYYHNAYGNERSGGEHRAPGGGFDYRYLIKDMLGALASMWWLPLLLCVLFTALLCFNTKRSYRPHYTARATFTVQLVDTFGQSSADYSETTAQQLSAIFPQILASDVLTNLIKEDLGTDNIPATIKPCVEEDSVLFTIESTSLAPETAYEVLQSVIKNYLHVSDFVFGNTKLVLLSESGMPSAPANQISYRNSVAIGVLLGLALSAGVAFMFALTRTTVHDADELKSIFNLRCIGSLPYINIKKHSKEGRSILLTDRHVPKDFADSIRLIRARIEKSAEEHGEKVILITSSIPGEGKTTISQNIAVSLALKGRKVALIDCDLRRRSAIGELDGLKEAGLTEFLKGEAKLSEIVGATMPDLYVINGTTLSDNAAELFKSNNMKRLINLLKPSFDFVILDSPPSAVIADAGVLAQYADSIVYVVCRNYTRKGKILDGINNLTAGNARFMGYLMNNSSIAGAGSNYGRYGRYGGYGRYGRKQTEAE